MVFYEGVSKFGIGTWTTRIKRICADLFKYKSIKKNLRSSAQSASSACFSAI